MQSWAWGTSIPGCCMRLMPLAVMQLWRESLCKACAAGNDNFHACLNLQEYNPYDLVVVERNQVDPYFHFVVTQMGVTHMWGGVAYDLTPHHEWIRDAELFSILKKIVLFKKYILFQVRQCTLLLPLGNHGAAVMNATPTY